jgi:uncharacterized sulfatase
MAERYDLVRGVHDGRHLYLRNYLPHLSRFQNITYTYQMPTTQVWHRMSKEGKLKGPQADWFSPTKPLEELYDGEKDPWQLKNLAADPGMAPVLERLRKEHLRHLHEVRDLGFMPEHEMALRSGGKPPYEMRLDEAKYPFERIFAAADRVGRGGTTAGLLEDPDAAVRWWGCVGLTAAGEKDEALKKALKDESISVRIAAAEALGGEEAMPVLLEVLRHESEWPRLRALNVLDDMGEAARPAIPEIKKALKRKGRFGYDRRLCEVLLEKFEETP